MQIPLELSFRDVEKTPDVEKLIRSKVDRLERFCDHITSSRVAVEKPNATASAGNPYRVRIDITVPPGHELVVDKEPRDHAPNDSLRTVINSAFDAAERQLKALNDRQHGEVKTHADVEARAFVVKKFDDEGYGFIKTPDGREVYFHKNSVVEKAFGRVTVGTQVRFEETMGEMGPQATSVHILSKPGVLPLAELEGDDGIAPPDGWQAS